MDNQTQVNDHDLLVEIRTKLDTFIVSYTASSTDHEARLRVLEASNWKRIGASSLVAGAVYLAITLIKYAIR